MAETGLTNGAFYLHFDSKESLVGETVGYVLNMRHERLRHVIREGGIEAAVRDYLGIGHLTAPATGCASAALLPEIARASMQTRSAYLAGLEETVAILAGHLPGLDPETARQKAMALFSMMLGTLQIARAAPDPALAEAILGNGIHSALIFIGETPKPVAANLASC